jgi:hypothetical protein
MDIVEERLVGAGEGLGETLHDEAVLDGHRDRSSWRQVVWEMSLEIRARLAEPALVGKCLLCYMSREPRPGNF